MCLVPCMVLKPCLAYKMNNFLVGFFQALIAAGSDSSTTRAERSSTTPLRPDFHYSTDRQLGVRQDLGKKCVAAVLCVTLLQLF